ncbi:MAG TPA: hypothetical protein VGM02_13105 [Acidobacteriaceae bacterium]
MGKVQPLMQEGRVNAPISLITVGLNGDQSRNTTQSVKLTFARP